MQKIMSKILLYINIIIFLILPGCRQNNTSDQEAPPETVPLPESGETKVEIPFFNADSAYYFVEKQVSFGPRVPNTGAHVACGNWLESKMRGFADTVYIQQTRLRAYDGTPLNIKNIIGVFNPGKRNRILLCAHWDSRPWADHDPDPANHYTPIDGANDGGSGVGVLLEIARLLHQNNPQKGIDIIFFDAEDYGEHQSGQGRNSDSWALGSQYWATTPHKSDYFAGFGILLDMVGAYNASFKHEGYSMFYASNIVRKVWREAEQLGYGNLFINEEGGFITDDHVYVNEIRGIPTINIIDLRNDTPHGFFPYWHTVDDTMENIDPTILEATGKTVLQIIYD